MLKKNGENMCKKLNADLCKKKLDKSASVSCAQNSCVKFNMVIKA